jgi:hypothetical protein
MQNIIKTLHGKIGTMHLLKILCLSTNIPIAPKGIQANHWILSEFDSLTFICNSLDWLID